MSIKNKIIINFSEPLRTTLGDFYAPVQEASGTTAVYQRTPFPADPGGFDLLIGASYLNFAISDVARLTYVTGNSIVPSYKVPIRLYGITEDIKNNEFWKKYIMGGTFGTSSFGGIYSENVYRSLNFTYNTAYSVKEHNEFSELNTSHGGIPIEISAKYNYYLPQYESYLGTLNSVKMIPNAYLLAQRQFTDWATTFTDPGPSLSLPSSISSFVSLEHQTSTKTLFSKTTVPYLPPISGLYESVDTTGAGGEELYTDFTANLHNYFNDRLPYANISASTMANITRLGNNIIFDDHAMSTIFQHVETEAYKLPFYVNIDIPIVRQDDVMGIYGTNRLFADMLEQNTTNTPLSVNQISPNFVPYFMRLLKEHFADNRGRLRSVQSQNYKTKQKADLKTKKVSEIFEVENQEFASLNLIPALVANFNDTAPAYGEGEKNYILINTNEYIENMIANINSSYRYINSQLTLLFLNKVLDKVSFPNPLFLQNIGNFSGVTPTSDITIDSNFLYRFYGMAATTNYNETIAYRIVKIAGDATGESNTQNIVQNIWLYNYNNDDLSIDHHNFIDTQIGYGENITYKIYAYVIGVGARYKASDWVLSQDIGGASMETEQNIDMRCVEYYNPITGEPTLPLVDPAGYLGSTVAELDLISPNVGIAHPSIIYQADFNLNFEPVIEIVEVPIFEKTISVLDNPAHAHDVVPFQKMNASQEIGFLLSPESFVPGPMPIPLTEEEEAYKKSYLESQDIIEGGTVRNSTKSPHTLVKIYRMTTKPRNLQEFALYQYSEKDLTEVAQGAENPKCVFYDKLKTNQKYYYLFRFFNQHGAMGHLSPIIEAELVSDGGYIYSTFEVIPIEELDDPKDINPSIPLKKILSIIPNLNQLRIDTTDVDFLEPAETQLENLKVGSPELSELLWGRDFKIRLTSTKTGKKIDLNLKFHINEET